MNLRYSEKKISAFCQHYHIRRMSLFGSVLRDDFDSASDVDVLVEFEPGTRVSLLQMGAMQVELSGIMGREVDLKTAGYISRYFVQDVLAQAQPIYERAG